MNKKVTSRAENHKHDSVEVVSDVPVSEVAAREEKMQAFWDEQDIFNKSVVAPAGATPKGDFVFYDGPPFATGLPSSSVTGTISRVELVIQISSAASTSASEMARSSTGICADASSAKTCSRVIP